MVKGGKDSGRSNFRKRVSSKDKGSDDSDEDYVVSDEENEVTDDDSEEYCSSLDECASEESLGGFVEEEDEEEEKEVRKVVRPTVRWGSFAKEKVGDKTSKKRKRVSYRVEEDEDYEGAEEAEDDDDDEEFVMDEDDCLDEEEELNLTRKKNMKMNKKGLQKRGPRGGRNRKKYAVSKEPNRKRGRKKSRLKRKNRVNVDDCDYDDYSDSDFRDSIPAVRKKSNTSLAGRKRKYHVSTDSDHVSSGSSDHEYTYTISEKEKEQVMETGELCGSLKAALRSSSSLGRIQDAEDSGQQKKPPVQKGKEKVEELKIEVVKQVCGICLSEEDRRRLRGTLDCCSHYFCFTCIMEWSKVESRCPLCKQRFKTISKPARSTLGVDLREVAIQVPERDQVYHPSEEELRSYLDPYENVICSECHQGGDDGLMLLCDLCDSSAHTYCVGLGREVPEGNWYCDGCRPGALVSSSSQAQDFLSDQRTMSSNLYSRPSPIVNLGESVEPTVMSSPCTPFTQGFGNLSSPRLPVLDVSAASPLSGAGAPTLTGRRWIHRHIQNLLSGNRMNLGAMRGDGMSTANLANDFLNPQIDQGQETTAQQSSVQESGTLYTIFGESSQNNLPSSLQSRDIFSQRLGHLRRQVIHGTSTATMDSRFNLTLWPEHAGISSISGNNHLNQLTSGLNIGLNGSPHMVKEEGDFSMMKEQLQTMVGSHLKNLSRDIDLGSNFKDIARHSTQTILAACGLEHMRNEVHSVPPPSVCPHVERLEAGQRSLMKGCCSTCFDSFVKDVVKRVMDTSLPRWLSLGL
ncbi:hypothetical protein SLE2022_081300 [Rubroshorea leprosula]